MTKQIEYGESKILKIFDFLDNRIIGKYDKPETVFGDISGLTSFFFHKETIENIKPSGMMINTNIAMRVEDDDGFNESGSLTISKVPYGKLVSRRVIGADGKHKNVIDLVVAFENNVVVEKINNPYARNNYGNKVYRMATKYKGSGYNVGTAIADMGMDVLAPQINYQELQSIINGRGEDPSNVLVTRSMITKNFMRNKMDMDKKRRRPNETVKSEIVEYILMTKGDGKVTDINKITGERTIRKIPASKNRILVEVESKSVAHINFKEDLTQKDMSDLNRSVIIKKAFADDIKKSNIAKIAEEKAIIEMARMMLKAEQIKKEAKEEKKDPLASIVDEVVNKTKDGDNFTGGISKEFPI